MTDFRMIQSQRPQGGVLQSFFQGRQLRQNMDRRNALAAYATDPDSQDNFNALAQAAPEFAIQERSRRDAARIAQQKRDEAERTRVVTAAALTGDADARKQLAYYNSEMFLKLDDRQKEQIDETMKSVGNTAFQILQLPEEQQGPALQQALQGLQAQGMDISGIDMNQPPRQILRAALAMTGQLDEWEKFSQPRYIPVGEGGLSGFQYGQPIQQNGQPKNFGGPQVGAIEDGYRFNGGNPADPNSWEKVGGSAGNGAGGF